MSDIRGIGVDLCGISRMETLTENESFLQRCFEKEECEYIRSKGSSSAQTLAGMFAAKEAVLKAFGLGLTLSMRNVHIRHSPLGQPQVRLDGKAASLGGRILLSVSHEGDTAAAFALWQTEEE